MANQYNFRPPTNKEFSILKSELEHIKALLGFIDEKLLYKDIVIKTKSKEIIFKIDKRNISHLLGISYKGGSKSLWYDYKKNRLSSGNISVKKRWYNSSKIKSFTFFSRSVY